MIKMWCKKKTSEKAKRFLGLALAFVITLSTTVGILEIKSTKALEGDPVYWMATEDGLTLTIESVEQNGLSIAPVWSNFLYSFDTGSFGDYYFPVANNTDTVRLGVRVDGMEAGQSYRIFDNQTLTSANNGQVIYSDVRPSVYMQDSVTTYYDELGEPHLSITPRANEYTIGAYLSTSNYSSSVSKSLIVRPARVGSQNIEIVSVRQNGNDLFLDTVGRQATSWEEMENIPQTINEYRIDDYRVPVTVTFKLKNLVVGNSYSFNAGGGYTSFTADAGEKTFTRELSLDYVDKHLNDNITVYRSDDYNDNDTVRLYFRIADENFVSLGDIIIDDVRQNGVVIVPTEGTSYTRQYTFRANDVQPISIGLHATMATSDLDYYVFYSMNGDGAYINSQNPIRVSGEELANGAVLAIPSGYGLSESSPLTMYFYVNTVGENVHNFTDVFYQNYGDESNHNGDQILINYYEDNTLPRFDAEMLYTNHVGEVPGIFSEMINARYHDVDHPLGVRITGERYEAGRTYNIVGRVSRLDEEIYNRTFTATGAELNAGKNIVLDGLALTLPEFDPSGDTSGYELWYNFSLEIDGLELSGAMIYKYDGWISTMMTYPGGRVSASGDASGMGGAMYMTSTGTTVRRTSLDGTREVVIHYLGGGFDEDLSYQYAIYYNGSVSNEWWSAAAGTKLEEGTVTGVSLNNEGLTVNVAVPSNEAQNAMYSLVITRNGGLVIVSKDFLSFTDAPMIESFTFSADDDSFMQTGRQSYRVAKNTDITATLTGAGFGAEEEYRVWVSYSGYRYVEGDGYSYGMPVDLSELDTSVVVNGAILNGGYEYVIGYDDAFNETDSVEVRFDVTDRDAERPNRYDGMGGGEEPGSTSYNGHTITIEYVNEEDVFNEESGFQIEETGEIVNVAQPEHHDELVDNRASAVAETTVDGGTMTLAAQTPCVVVGVRNGEYVVIEAGAGEENNGVTTNQYDVSEYDQVVVAVKGDGDFDGAVSSADSNLINRSLISHSMLPYRPLSDLERVVLDIDGDGTISTADSNLINRSLISPTLPPYRSIRW